MARLPDSKNWRSPRILQWRAAQVAIVPESQVRMASSLASRSNHAHQVLRLDRATVGVLQGGHVLAPGGHALLGVLEKAAVSHALQQRQQRRKGGDGVADQRHLGRHAVAGADRVGVDLDGAAWPGSGRWAV